MIKNQKKRERGFSIIELMVFTAVIAILSAIGFTQYTRYIKQAGQVQAKKHLAMIYKQQHTYRTEHNLFEFDLIKISAIPKGPVRYNVGADWDSSHSRLAAPAYYSFHGENINSPSIEVCGCCNGSSTYTRECCMDPNPNKTDTAAQCPPTAAQTCYGGKLTGDIDSTIQQIVGGSTPQGYFKGTNTTFKYYAFGCAIGSRLDKSNFDLWSMDHRKHLKHIQDGSQF